MPSAAALIAATGGLALAAAPGVFGAGAITSALAAFGPGGMVGGLLTAGALGSAGGGVAIGIASPTTTAETVEAVVAAQLTAAILRKRHGLEQDPTSWAGLVDTGMALRREHAHLEAFSGESAPILKELKRKLKATDRALT